MRHRVAVEQEVSLLDKIALADADVLALGDQVLGGIAAVFGANDDASLRLVVLAVLDDARNLAHYGVVLGDSRLEEFGDARQTTRNVPRLGRFTGDAGQDIAGVYLGRILDRQDSVHRKESSAPPCRSRV